MSVILRRLLSSSNIFCNGTNSDCTSEPNVGLALMALLVGVILALSLAMNSVVCVVFYKKSYLLSVSNSFVLNLSCCQLCKYLTFNVWEQHSWLKLFSIKKCLFYIGIVSFQVCQFSLFRLFWPLYSLQSGHSTTPSARCKDISSRYVSLLFSFLSWLSP